MNVYVYTVKIFLPIISLQNNYFFLLSSKISFKTAFQVAPHGSVATDNLKCSEIGTYILKKGGNSADAAIASAFCMAVVAPHITGLDAYVIIQHKIKDKAF